MTQYQAAILVHLDPAIRRELKQRVAQKDTTMSAVIRQLISDFLAAHQPEGRATASRKESTRMDG